MNRNQYDTDVTVFSPQGRLFQVEYAQEAVKQGSATCALRSKDFAVLAAIKRAPNELASFQQKIFKIDDHMGIGISGLVADARTLAAYMRNECLNYRYGYNSAKPVGRLSAQIADKAQAFTQKSEKRPYGVGLLIIGFDKTGPHVFENMPSGNYFEYVGQAMGARSQSAKTYLEKHYEEFADNSKDELIMHALEALKGCAGGVLTSKNVSVGFVGKDAEFTELEGDSIAPYVDRLEQADEAKDEEGDEESEEGSDEDADEN